MIDIIQTKKNGHMLSEAQIQAFVKGVVSGEIADYQTAALLMAIRLNGMCDAETTALTVAIANSGDTLDLSDVEGITADKHSSGGVSDSTTLIIAPLIAACGVKAAKLSGRGLGHTGGTIDKLESFENIKTEMSVEQFKKSLATVGAVVGSASANLAPCDKILYALRDVTATVDSLPLIASSIMSKKLAGGAGIILLDVKYGAGAFMKTPQEAIDLAKTMVRIGKSLSRKTAAFISSMEQPLGNFIGCSSEVGECISVLKGQKGQLRELSLRLSEKILELAGLDKGLAQKKLDDGSAYKKFVELVNAQGGEYSESFEKARCEFDVVCASEGYIQKIDCQELGMINVELGGGRKKKNDSIDHSVGLFVNKRLGEKAKKGELLGKIFAAKADCKHLTDRFEKAFMIGEQRLDVAPLVFDIVE